MRPEMLSTARPTRLRLAGFVALVLGALAAALGSLLVWATIGFPQDRAGNLDVPTYGIDVWEGIVVLAIAAAALALVVVMRVTRSARVRRRIATSVVVGGILVIAIAAIDLITARSRFGGSDDFSRLVRYQAARAQEPAERVRQLFEQNFGSNLRVDVGPGLILTLVGGVLLIAAGVLALLWSRSTVAGGAAAPDGAEPSSPLDGSDRRPSVEPD